MRLQIGAMVLAMGFVLAACQSQSADPRLKTASTEALQERARSTCLATQSKIQNASVEKVSRGCGCYAAKAIKSFNEAELAEYRDTGVFGATARDKALKALDVCRVPRP